MTEAAVERVELARVAGKMLAALEYLRAVQKVGRLEGRPTVALDRVERDLSWARGRIVELSEALPEGPLEAFAREHPLRDDQLDGPFCGYGHEHGAPYKCPEPDWPKHWDAWEMMGTRLQRPPMARRPK